MKAYILSATTVITLFCSTISWAYFFPEIRDPSLKEIAMVRADPNWSAIVIYNPDLCAKVGEACGFIKTHEFAHIQLNHGLLAMKSMYTPLTRARADCWAAKQGKPNEVKAAVELFLDESRHKDLPLYGDLSKRALHIKECAEKGNNWLF